MRYIEIIESAEQSTARRTQEKQRKARERIASADRKRSDAASRYQDQVKACDDAITKARAALRETYARSYTLRDRTGALLGWIEAHGYLVQGKDRRGRLVGWYDPRLNVTRDAKGARVGKGDLLAALIVCQR